MSPEINFNDSKFENFFYKTENTPKEELIKELYRTTVLCDENEEIMENLMDGIFISDGNGVALQANAAYEKLSGLSRKEWMENLCKHLLMKE